MAIELQHLHPSHDDEVSRLKARIAELEEERRWRKFSDEKPEEWDTVIVRIGDGFYDLAVYMSNGQGWDIGDGTYHKPEEVTHWMPLPSAPKEVKPAPRIATNRELAKWLAQGKGEWCNCIGDNQRAAIEWWYDQGYSEKAAKNVFVRKWDDEEWHTPDVEYMGITEVKTYEDVVKREG